MAIKFVIRTAGGIDDYIVSWESEIQKLPVDITQGSTAFCIETSTVWMFEADNKKWVQI